MIDTIYKIYRSSVEGVKSYVTDDKSYILLRNVSKSHIGDTPRVNGFYGGDIKSYLGIR